jgi:hypothetical protein
MWRGFVVIIPVVGIELILFPAYKLYKWCDRALDALAEWSYK